MSRFVIHGVPLSPYVRAVSIVLAEKGESFVVQLPAKAGLKTEPHLSRHPFGMIPVLDHDGFELYETQAILRYVDRLIPAPALTPRNIRDAARMDQVMNITDQYLMNGVNRIIGFQRVIGPLVFGLTPDLAVIEEAMPRARLVLKVLNDFLMNQACLAGDALSLADIIAFPHVEMLASVPEWAELSPPNPALVAWHARLRALPSVCAVLAPSAARRAA